MRMRYFVCAQKGLNYSFFKKPKVNLLNITHQIFFSFFTRYFGNKNRFIYKNSSFFIHMTFNCFLALLGHDIFAFNFVIWFFLTKKN